MRVLLDVLLLVPALLLQNTLLGRFTVHGVGLDLLAAVLAAIACAQGWMAGGLCGLLCGIVMDGVFGHVGYYALQYLLLGMTVGLLRERWIHGHLLLPVLSLLIGYALKELVPVLYLYLTGAEIGWMAALLRVAVSAGVCAAVFIPLHLLVQRLHRWDVISGPDFRFHGRNF